MTTWEVHHADCLDLMRGMPAESVDLIVADPPYGIGFEGWVRMNGETLGRVINDEHPFVWWLHDAARVLKPTGAIMVFHRWDVAEFWRQCIEATGLVIRSQVVWSKGGGGVGDCGRAFAPSHEVAWFASKQGFSFQSGRLVTSVLTFGKVPPGAMVHPTEKPLDLYEYIVKYCCPPGGTVLDPFVGAGASGQACVRLDRNFIGAELDPGHVATARGRIQDAVEAAGGSAAGIPGRAVPTGEDVLQAALGRVRELFDLFDTVAVMVSGGPGSLAALRVVQGVYSELYGQGHPKVAAIYRDEELVPATTQTVVQNLERVPRVEVRRYAIPFAGPEFEIGGEAATLRWDPARVAAGNTARTPPEGSFMGERGIVYNQATFEELVCRELPGKVALVSGERCEGNESLLRATLKKPVQPYLWGSGTPKAKVAKVLYDWTRLDADRFLCMTDNPTLRPDFSPAWVPAE